MKAEADNKLENIESIKPSKVTQAVLTVLARRDSSKDKNGQSSSECLPINLSSRNLIGADLSKANFGKSLDCPGVNFAESDLRGTNLFMADLRGANLSRATMTDSYLPGAQFDDANLYLVDLSQTKTKGPRPGLFPNFEKAKLCRTTLRDNSVEKRDCRNND